MPTIAAAAVAGMALLTRQVALPRTHTPSDVPATPVAIVLGAQVHPDGRPSGFLVARLELALELWRTGKVDVILVSGHDGAEHHHETQAMADWLRARGVPPVAIVGDPHGHDTFATISRAVGVYGLEEAIVITQSYHLPRTLATARALGLDARGVGDTSASRWPRYWRRGRVRELFANVKLFGELITRERPDQEDPQVLVAIRETGR